MTAWHLDPETLREVVDDRRALETELESASPHDRVWMLRLLDRLDEAEREGRTMLDHAGADRWRGLLLLADVLRWRGDAANAAHLQEEAARLADSPARRATTAQHIGKRLFEEGRLAEAAAAFGEALAIREAIGAPDDQVASSRQARARALRR